MNAILDAGAFVAIDRRDRKFGAMLRVLQPHVAVMTEDGDRVLTSDADDLEQLVRARGVEATIVAV